MVKKERTSVQVAQVVALNDLGIDIQKKDMSSKSLSLAVRQLLQNWRQGTLGVKGRSDVAKSNKKPWKQKGTGRARAGSARSPLWRGGGIIFGPQPRTRTLKVSKNLRRGVFNKLFWDYLEQNKIYTLDWLLDSEVPKTALAFKALKDSNLVNDHINLFLPSHDELLYSSFINIPNVQILFFDEPNAYALALADRWVFLKRDTNEFKEMVSKWI